MDEEDVFHKMESYVSGKIISADPAIGSSIYPTMTLPKTEGSKGTRYVPDMIIVQSDCLLITEIKPTYQISDISKIRDILNLGTEKVESRLVRHDVADILDLENPRNIPNQFQTIKGCFVYSGSIPSSPPSDVILVNIDSDKISVTNDIGAFSKSK